MTQNNLFKNKQELEQHIRKEIYKILEKYGYKKNDNNFYIEKQELCCVINIQYNRFTDLNEKIFTLNWGIYCYKDVYFYGEKKPKKISFSNCSINGRVSWLKTKNDKWWKLHIDSSLEQLSKTIKEIEYYLINFGIPFLNKMNKIQDVIDMLETTKTGSNFHSFFSSHPNPEAWQAILYLYINQKEKSLKIINNIINKNNIKSDIYLKNMNDLKDKIEKFTLKDI